MKIEHVNIFFQKIYVAGKEFVSMPVADISIKEMALPRRVSLDRTLITQDNVREIRIGGNFFAVKTTTAFVIYSASGKKLDIIDLNTL